MAEKKISTWTVDPGHSLVQFKVKHLAISTVSGNFNTFQGTLQTEQEDFNNAKIQFQIDTNSIDTNNAERDKHLKSDMFLNVDKYPKIKFQGTLQGDKLIGDLTLLETTKAVQMELEQTGIGQGRFGETRAGFEVTGKINRKDFGVNFHLLTDAGNLIVGEEVKLSFNIQLIKQ
jgi:polyisoprenoid-binding protein YceI